MVSVAGAFKTLVSCWWGAVIQPTIFARNSSNDGNLDNVSNSLNSITLLSKLAVINFNFSFLSLNLLITLIPASASSENISAVGPVKKSFKVS